MPLYEYRCRECQAEFEAITSFANADHVACEACGSTQVERIASAFACSISNSGGGGGAPVPACGGGG